MKGSWGSLHGGASRKIESPLEDISGKILQKI